MDAGLLRALVLLQSPPSGQDTEGQPSGSWSTVATLHADIRHVAGLEAVKAGADSSVVKASARIRWRTNVASGMRLLKGTTVYMIQAVLPDAGRRHVDLVCEVIA
jgi:SPP1 family predicted phage head-tail adaptor